MVKSGKKVAKRLTESGKTIDCVTAREISTRPCVICKTEKKRLLFFVTQSKGFPLDYAIYHFWSLFWFN
jgi:hypothetical protein